MDASDRRLVTPISRSCDGIANAHRYTVQRDGLVLIATCDRSTRVCQDPSSFSMRNLIS